MAIKLSLLDLSMEEFVNKVVSMTAPRPKNYSIVIKVNKGTIINYGITSTRFRDGTK